MSSLSHAYDALALIAYDISAPDKDADGPEVSESAPANILYPNSSRNSEACLQKVENRKGRKREGCPKDKSGQGKSKAHRTGTVSVNHVVFKLFLSILQNYHPPPPLFPPFCKFAKSKLLF